MGRTNIKKMIMRLERCEFCGWRNEQLTLKGLEDNYKKHCEENHKKEFEAKYKPFKIEDELPKL